MTALKGTLTCYLALFAIASKCTSVTKVQAFESTCLHHIPPPSLSTCYTLPCPASSPAPAAGWSPPAMCSTLFSPWNATASRTHDTPPVVAAVAATSQQCKTSALVTAAQTTGTSKEHTHYPQFHLHKTYWRTPLSSPPTHPPRADAQQPLVGFGAQPTHSPSFCQPFSQPFPVLPPLCIDQCTHIPLHTSTHSQTHDAARTKQADTHPSKKVISPPPPQSLSPPPPPLTIAFLCVHRHPHVLQTLLEAVAPLVMKVPHQLRGTDLTQVLCGGGGDSASSTLC